MIKAVITLDGISIEVKHSPVDKSSISLLFSMEDFELSKENAKFLADVILFIAESKDDPNS